MTLLELITRTYDRAYGTHSERLGTVVYKLQHYFMAADLDVDKAIDVAQFIVSAHHNDVETPIIAPDADECTCGEQHNEKGLN